MQETQETRVRSLGQEHLLEEETATHSSILGWKIPWTEEAGGLYSPQGTKSRTWLNTHVAVKPSQGPLVPPQELETVFWAMSFELICRYWNPPPGGRRYVLLICTQTPDWVEPEGWWCWLLIISPPTNQTNVHELTAHLTTLLFHPVFKNPSLQALGNFASFKH